MSNFFNAIGLAAMERVHSAVIGWILSDKCDAFGIEQKSEILCKLFKVKPLKFYKIDVKVEVYDIDILVTTERNGIEECWVIENKIKSNQHSNQLDKYVRIIRGEEMTSGKNPKPITEKYQHIQDENQHYCFLTLIEETAIGTHQDLWINKQYCDLVKLLSSLSLPICSNEDRIVFEQYRSCITEMTDALNDFLCKPQNNYPHVFTDGSKKQTEKDFLKIAKDSGKYARYIAENGLETIFQKCFLIEVIKQTTNFKSQHYTIKETHGTALWEYLCDTINGTNFRIHFGIQFQNGTFKVQVFKVIDNTLPQEEKEQLVKQFWGKWNVFFGNSPSLIPDWHGPNKSKEQKGPYFSFSMKTELGEKWYLYPKEKIASYWDEMYKKCQSALKILKSYYQQT